MLSLHWTIRLLQIVQPANGEIRELGWGLERGVAYDRGVRKGIAALLIAVGLLGAGAVAATAKMSNGLPAYTRGYGDWPKLNRKPVRGGSPAHSGVKNTYASKPQSERANRFPNGTVIVKSIARPGATGLPAMVAVMRKVKGKWQWAEYSLSGSRYSKLAIATSVCTGCHVGAKQNDWVFTRK
jgi:hypothetical protein